MDNFIADIQEKFGIDEVPHGLFYNFDHALRFELGGEEFGTDRPMRRFLRAHERANIVARSFFEKSSEIFVLLSSYGTEQPDKTRLKPLKLCGIRRSDFRYLGKTAQCDGDHIKEFGSDLFHHMDVAKLDDKRMISEILWLGIATEMGIEPRFKGGASAYIMDVENGLILHLYDDRGMDIVSVQKAAAAEIYTRYNDWLLGYDIARMTNVFGQAASSS